MEYNSGNINKYMTKNPLKRKMVSNLNEKILFLVKAALDDCRETYHNRRITNILDAGCGEGFISNLIYSYCSDVEITGLEYIEEAILIARNMNSRIAYVQGDITNMPFKSESFDIVLCTEVLEHLSEPATALSELLRVAKKKLIVTVPHEPWFCMGNMVALKNITRFGNPIDHINHWTFNSFASFLNINSKESWTMEKSFPWTIAYCTKSKYD